MTKLVVIKDSEELKYLYSLFLMETGRCQSVSNGKKVIQIEPDPQTYFDDVFHKRYQFQLDVYAYLLANKGFNVSPVAYILVCNANQHKPDFKGALTFSETFIPYEWKTGYLSENIKKMYDVMKHPEVPQANPACKNCSYSIRRSIFDHTHLADIIGIEEVW